MPNEIVEGYTASQQAGSAASSAPPSSLPPGPAGDAWITGLRKDLRREMIRELALRRIHQGSGRENQPEPPTRFSRMVEAFFVGVAVTLVSSWVCTRAMRDAGRDDPR